MSNKTVLTVFKEFVQLKKMGEFYIGFSPFSGDKEHAFLVYPNRNAFYDDYLNFAGGVVDFLMRHENLSEAESFLFLKNRYGLLPNDVEICQQQP